MHLLLLKWNYYYYLKWVKSSPLPSAPGQSGGEKQVWGESCRTGAEPARVCRITDGRLASWRDPAALRSFNSASHLSPLFLLLRNPVALALPDRLPRSVCVCVFVWASSCSSSAGLSSPSQLQDWWVLARKTWEITQACCQEHRSTGGNAHASCKAKVKECNE